MKAKLKHIKQFFTLTFILRFIASTLLFFVLHLSSTIAANYEPVQDGDFDDSNTWGGSVPSSNDKINFTYWESTFLNREVTLTSNESISNITLKGGNLNFIISATSAYTLNIDKLTISNEATFIINENVTLVVNDISSFNSATFLINNGASIVFNSNVTSAGGGALITISDGANVQISAILNLAGGATTLDVYGYMEVDDLSASGGSQLINVYAEGLLQINNDATFTGSAGFSIQNEGVVSILGDMDISGGASGTVDGELNVLGTLTVPNYETPKAVMVNEGGIVRAGEISGESVGGPGMIEQGTALPIELSYFDASVVQNKVLLSWETATEENNDFFTIERSYDGVIFTPIGIIAGAGNSNSAIYYETEDENPNAGTNYYRLKQTDYDGAFTYSKIKSIGFSNNAPQELAALKIYPNPISQADFLLSLDFPYLQNNETAIIIVYSISGQELLYYEVELDSYNNRTKIDVSNLKTGHYLLVVLFTGNKYKEKLVVM